MGRGTGRSPGPPAAQSSLPVVSGQSWQDASAKVPGPDLPQAMLPSAPIRNPPRHVYAIENPSEMAQLCTLVNTARATRISQRYARLLTQACRYK